MPRLRRSADIGRAVTGLSFSVGLKCQCSTSQGGSNTSKSPSWPHPQGWPLGACFCLLAAHHLSLSFDVGKQDAPMNF